MKLRDYQEKAVEAVIESWKTSRSCVVVLPTGCGKTIVFSEAIKRRLEETDKRVMVLAHREELITQAQEKIGLSVGCNVGVEMGEFKAEGSFFEDEPPVVVSTIQTQITGRIGKFLPEEFETLIIDEAHHATAKSYRACVEHYFQNPNCKLLGVTATPDRADERALGLVFEKVAFEYSVADAIRDGWLVPIRQKLVTVGSLDYSKISTTAGDFNQGELGEVLEEERNLHAIASPTIEVCKNRRAIVFAATVKQAERLAEIINRHIPNAADWLSGKTPKEERREKLQRFKNGEFKFLVNVGVLTEGFDDAGVEAVVMARPTKSRALYAQMAGRGTRPHGSIASDLGNHDARERCAMIAASAKKDCLIVDFVGNSGRHKLVSSVDILGGKDFTDEEKDLAREIIGGKRSAALPVGSAPRADRDEMSTLEALEKARAEIVERKLTDAAKRAFIQIKAEYSVTSVNPFDVMDIPPVDAQARKTNRIKLSWKQREIIRNKLKIDPDSISSSEGRALLDEYFRRIKDRLASFGQMRYLRRHGYPCPMSFAEASSIITSMIGGNI